MDANEGMHPERTASPSGTIPSLDGIRAVAVTIVFLAHTGLEHWIPGGLGVTIFFVLSGFLITTLMRIEHAREHRIDFAAFYLRRILRLFPPLVVVVAAALLLSAFDVIGGEFSPSGLLSLLFYFGNYHAIATDFQGIPLGLGIMWSLAVEEHYYLFYPPLAALLLRVGNVRISASVLLLLCLAVLLHRVGLAHFGVPERYISMATDTRIDAILVGCAMAMVRNPWLDPVAVAPSRAWTLLAACLALLLLTLVVRDEFFRLTLRYSLQSLAIAPLIYLAIVNVRQAPFRWLNARPMVYIGTVSYTIYLSHQLVLFGVERHWPELGWAGTTATTALLTLAVAEAMRRSVELPSARLRKRLHRRHPAPITESSAIGRPLSVAREI